MITGAGAEELQQRESDTLFQFGGGARLRYFQYDRAGGGGVLPNEEDFTNTSSRFQFDMRLDKGEYFQTYFRAINTGNWGSQSDDRSEFTIQQAWANWRVDDFLTLKFGRQDLEIGRGLVYGYNEWENLPNFYDGVSLLFDWSVMELSFHALQIYDLERAAASSAADPEVFNYIVDIRLKEISDMIQLANVYFVQSSGDIGQIPNTTTVLNKERLTRFGLDFILGGLYYQFGSSLVFTSGDTRAVGEAEEKAKQFMADVELRFMVPSWEQLNFWVGAHIDSGDDADDGENQQYNPLFYNIHQNAGRLDFFKFGNLTFFRTGLSMEFLSDWSFGTEVLFFQKTKEGASNFLATSLISDLVDNGTVAFGADKDLGTEFDFWVAKKFRSGVVMDLGVNVLSPGEALKTATTSGSLSPIDKTMFNVYLDVGVFF